jgi:O-antigen ligase
LLGLFTVGLVIPSLDIPGWGISASTPIFCFVALDLALGQAPLDWRPYRKWILLAALFWAGQFLSIAGNVLAGSLPDLSRQDILHLIRLAYWMTVFAGTIALVSRWSLGPWLCGCLASSLIGLCSLRLMEALSLDTWGPAKALLYTPNGYGFLFSAFTPFLLWLVLTERGWRRLLYGAGLIITVFAIAGNGSRSSWVAVTLGALLVGFLFALTQSGSIARISSVAAAGVVAAFLVVPTVPEDLLQPLRDRFSSLERLDLDKSRATRVVLLKKAADLFSQNPVLGVGAGRFRSAGVPLEIPPVLHFQNEQDLNRRSAHNAYAGLLAESGVLGAAPLAALLLVLICQGWLAVWRGARNGMAWSIPVYAAFLGMSVHLGALAGLTGAVPWFVYGLVAATIHHKPV